MLVPGLTMMTPGVPAVLAAEAVVAAATVFPPLAVAGLSSNTTDCQGLHRLDQIIPNWPAAAGDSLVLVKSSE